jgi:CRISPR-associated protein Cst1
MLAYTGHPFVDIGIATMVAFANKRIPAEVTTEDLEAVAAYIERNYVVAPLRGHMTMAFTSNGWFIQDAFNPDRPDLSPEQREQRRATRAKWATNHLHQWRTVEASDDDQRCVFTGLPISTRELSSKLAPGRIGRNQLPGLQGDDAINFFVGGDPGLPVSGIALLALQFFPMGCAKCGNGLLAVHADDEELTYLITHGFWKENTTNVAKAQAAGEDKLPSAARSVKTLLVEQLVKAEQLRGRREGRRERATSLTAYNFNNGKSPSLDLYYLPLEITDFIRTAQAYHPEMWQQLVARSWELPPTPKGKKAAASEFVPQEARRFIRSYFLRIPRRTSYEQDPRRGYSFRRESDLISWPIVALFLRKVVNMEPERIAKIAEVGDRLAQYVRTEGGKKFFRAFFTEQRSDYFRGLLIKANLASVRAGHSPLFDLDGYVSVFMEGDELLRPDWRLARDLVLIRMIDQLKDWLVTNPDVTPDLDDAVAETASESTTVQ